jgi:hypothetical protein
MDLGVTTFQTLELCFSKAFVSIIIHHHCIISLTYVFKMLYCSISQFFSWLKFHFFSYLEFLIPKHDHPKEFNDTKYNKKLILFQGTQVHHYLV